MNPQPFDPFRHRLSRDIRNQLSESLLACLRTQSLAPARAVAGRFLAENPGPAQADYINERLVRYARFLGQVQGGPADALWQSLVLWDLELFFEVHELLEHAWLKSQGEEKGFLQAMIRAAGLYIKRQHGFDEAGAKMAAKALPVLEVNRFRLAVYTDPDRLLDALRAPSGPPPLLLDRVPFPGQITPVDATGPFRLE